MLNRKPVDTTPFDRARRPPRQNPLFMPFIWLACWLLTRSGRLRIHKVGMRGLKPPFLVLGTHHAFMDFFVTPLALFPHCANYVSELEGFENYGEWLYRQAGCLGTRKFVSDIALVRNIKYAMAQGRILVLYPEARYTNAGTFSGIPDSVGKLAKHLDVPVVCINMRGNYLQSPIWNLKKRRGARLEATITQLFSCSQLRDASIEQVNAQIRHALSYDEHAWQAERNMVIDDPWRAEGLELVLYHCPHCGAEHKMQAAGARLSCGSCGFSWDMTTLGRLVCAASGREAGAVFSHIPDWYEWQRTQVANEINSGRYRLDVPVRIESLPNAKNFIDLGVGRLLHTDDGFFLTLRDYGRTKEQTLHFSPAATYSVHTEYNYRGKGQCITLSTPDNTYFLFPEGAGFNATKIQFAAEHMHQLQKSHPTTS